MALVCVFYIYHAVHGILEFCEYFRALPLPPAHLATSWSLSCRLNGFAGMENDFQGFQSLGREIQQRKHVGYTSDHCFCLFLAPRSFGTIFGTILRSGGSHIIQRGPGTPQS